MESERREYFREIFWCIKRIVLVYQYNYLYIWENFWCVERLKRGKVAGGGSNFFTPSPIRGIVELKQLFRTDVCIEY